MNNRQEIYIITGIILFFDQLIKLIINNTMNLYQEIVIIPKVFSIYFTKNTGAAFSILENNTTLLIIITVIIIYIIDKFIKKETSFNKLSTISLGLVMGGIFGNLIDRIIHHGVIDYLSFSLINFKFPVFNLADICITMGVFFLFISLIKDKKEDKK